MLEPCSPCTLHTRLTDCTDALLALQLGGCHCVVAGELADGHDLFAEYNNGGSKPAHVSVHAVTREGSYEDIATKHSRVRGYGSSDSSEDDSGHHTEWTVRIKFIPAGHATFGESQYRNINRHHPSISELI